MSENLVHTPFEHSWKAEILQKEPLIAPARQYMYPLQVPGEEDAMSRGAMLVGVRTAEAGSFLARCALGFKDPSLPSGVWSCPGPDDLLAVAGGYAYRVNTAEPGRCEFLALRPVTAILAAPADDLLLLAGFHHVLALGRDGVRWESARLSWEGVTLREVLDGHLQGEGWDMFADREVPFRVDLRTGEHEGGGYRR